MPKTVVFTYLLAVLLTNVCTSAIGADEPEVTIANPDEAGAVEIQTKYKNKVEVKDDLGEPTRIRPMGEEESEQCAERWFYMGKVDLGFGVMDLLTYIDFDADGNVCHGSN